MRALIDRIGALDVAARRRGRPADPFGSLLRSVVGQQLSMLAARSIFARIVELAGGRSPDPEQLLGFNDAQLRAAGLSGQKVACVRDLAKRVLARELDLSALPRMSDEEIVERVTAVRGLGRWTAEMFLMFHLGRSDVLPVGDLGIRRAVERAYQQPDLPSAQHLSRIAEPWRPYRTLACLYLWESLGNVPNPTPP